MLEYHAAYYKSEDGWYVVQLLDFPDVVSQGRTLKSAQLMIRDALRGMAEWLIEDGQPLPQPDRKARDRKADYAETIPLKARFTCGSPG